MRTLPDRSVNCCVTSPPYFGLRDYGMDGQIGLEPTPAEFVARLVDVFREVKRVLRDDGTLWLNIGDSYSRNPAKGGSGPNGKHDFIPSYGEAQQQLAAYAKAGSSDGAVGRGERPGTRTGFLAEKQMLGIPWRVAFALQADGWYLRQDIIWHKPNPMPESVTDRCTKAHEYLFLLSKSDQYHYDADAVMEPAVNKKKPGRKIAETDHYGAGNGGNTGLTGFIAKYHEEGLPTHRNRRSVWTVPVMPFKGAHFATFPPALIEPCILAGCPHGGTVLDPFGGSGTTAVVAIKHGRDAILCELNPAYAALMGPRVLQVAGETPDMFLEGVTD
jgi:site-specific DNA-methyltransferase (adenine-specific)